MRTLQFLLATLLLIAIPLGVNAQDKFIKSDFKVRKNINLAMVDKDAVGGMLNANKSFAEIQVFDFGDEGTTIILNFRIETRDCGEDGKPAIIEGTHSWSGKRMMLGHTSNESGEELYVVMYGNQPCGTNALTKTRVNDGQPIWFLALSDSPEGSNFVGENLIGLDVDALRIVAEGVNALRTPQTSAIVITHYKRLLDYIVPDIVHVIKDGRIVKTAGRELVDTIEEKGYEGIDL